MTKASAAAKPVTLDVYRPIGPAGQRLTKHLSDPRGSGRARDDLSAQLLLEPQALLQRVGVRLVHLITDIGITNPSALFVETRLPVARGNLLDADGNLHGVLARPPVVRLRAAGPVPTAYP